MDKKILVDSYIQEAAVIIKKLDENNFPINAAFWFYEPEINLWRLYIGSDMYDLDGPIKSYTFIQKLMDRFKNTIKEISLDDITIVGAKDNLIKVLKTAMKTDKKAINGIRFTANTISNTYIDDAYIYRLS